MAFKKKHKPSGSAEVKQTPQQEILPPIKNKPAHLFVKGQSGNPAGRQRGSRNKFTEQFYVDIYEDWKKNGVKALEKCRKKDISTYCRIAASVVDKQIEIKQNQGVLDALLDQFSDEQIEQVLDALASISNGSGDTQKPKAKALPRK